MLLLCTGGSPQSYLLLSAYKGLFLVCLKVLRLLLHTLFIQFLWRIFFAFIWCRNPTYGCCGWYNDSCRDKSGLLEQIIIIVFSLHLGEPLVLDLAMLSSIHCSSSRLSVPLLDFFYWVYIRLTILWFLIQWLVVLSFFLGIFMCFFCSRVHGVSYRFHALKIPS